MRISRKFVSDAFFFFVLLLSSGAMEAFTTTANGADPQGSPLMKVAWACIYLVILLALFHHRREVGSLLRSNKTFVLFLVLSFVSIRWSVDSQATLQKSVALILSAMVGLEFARRYTIEQQLRLVWGVLALIMVLGVVAQVVFPGFVPDMDLDAGDGGWNGIVTTKNSWARLIVLAGLVVLTRPRRSRLTKITLPILMVIVLALLVASRSAGGLLIMVTMLALFVGFRALRWNRTRLVMLSAVLAVVTAGTVSYVVTHADQAARMLGKDATMTGRVPIWQESLQFVARSPVLGYGYAAFWSQNSRPGRLVREAIHWDTLPHAHNGYIDLALELGGVGLLLYFASYFIAMKRAALLVRRSSAIELRWPLAFLCVVFLYQLNEASIVSANQLIWILYSSVLFSVAIEAQNSALPLPEEADQLSAEAVVTAAGD